MMFFDDNTSVNGQDLAGYNFFPYNQAPALPHAVLSVRRESPLKLNNFPSLQQYTASSSLRTAKSGNWFKMPPKRTSSGSPSGTPGKVVKTEQKPEDFSNSVKKRLQSSTRTGQACDRCKVGPYFKHSRGASINILAQVRKIRCDGLPGGCSPCLQNQTECRTTDRITGRAAPRGYVDSIEAQNRQMADRIRELENLCLQNGIDVKPSNAYHTTGMQPYSYNDATQNGHGQMWAPPPSNSYAPPIAAVPLNNGHQETNLFRALPAFRTGCTGDNYLGVSSGNSHLSSIKGTALTILGMEIDVADFSSNDMDEPDPSVFHPQLYNKSYQAFLQSALNVNPRIEKVDLPSRDEGITYAQWYFRVINPYCPVLHKGTFMSLVRNSSLS
jgi:hypothetical protein